jgi:hypothetical protein
MASGRVLFKHDGIQVTATAITCGQCSWQLAEITGCAIEVKAPKGFGGCLLWVGGIVLAFAAGAVEIDMKLGIVTGIFGAVLMVIGVAKKSPPERYVLRLATGGRKVNAWYTTDRQVSDRLAEALHKAFDGTRGQGGS